jgi:uncharacterized protein
VHLRSDIERKRLCGVGEVERLPAEAYRPEMSNKIYQILRNRATVALRAGQSVIVDAVHARPEERDALAAVAVRCAVPLTAFWLDASVETLVARVEARQNDTSDATPAIVREQTGFDLGRLDWTRLDANRPIAASLEDALRSIAARPS